MIRKQTIDFLKTTGLQILVTNYLKTNDFDLVIRPYLNYDYIQK